ncbi:MAG: ABC transporter ATP-binding protein, partial [Lachnospiraceae bacterium]|nr:ABC transporter ATP-binding protein [Lachnospiraceae bacterium]
MIKIIKKLSILLDKKQKRIMALLVVMMLIGAVLETLGVSLILPVMNIILEDNAVEKHAYLRWIVDTFHIEGTRNLTVFVMIALIGAFVVKNLFLFLQQKATLRFVYTNQFATSRRMMINYVKRPYEYYLNADSAVIQRSITSDVNNMYGLILALLQLLSEAIVFVTLVAVSFYADVWMTVTVTALLVAILFLIKVLIKPTMQKAGQENQDFYSGLFKWINQTVTGIKEIKISAKEPYFINEYSKCGAGYVNAVQRYSLFNSTPRLLIETVAIAGMVGYLLVMLLNGAEAVDIMPQITLLALVAMRLIPCANRMNTYLTSISYFEPFLMGVSDNLRAEISDKSVIYDEGYYAAKVDVDKLPVTKEIELKDITYKYPNTDTYIFDNASLTIPVGKSIGIVGSSGAGKTTIVDVMLGLLETERGSIYADGVNVNDNYQGWLKNIGYIPQTIFMLDSSIRKNVAFGVADEDIDDNKVWQALKEASL